VSGYETEAARAAAEVVGPFGLPLSPPVDAVRGGRPVLARVPGPRLNALVSGRPALAAAAGAVLGELHAHPCPVARTVQLGDAVTAPIGFASYLGLTPGQRRVLGVLHRDAELDAAARAALDVARSGTAWCHGDARTDNFCLRDGVPQLIDWEASGIGRPEVDLAALAASVVAGRLARGTASGDDSRALRIAVNQALQACRSDLAAVVEGYTSVGGTRPEAALLGALTGLSLLAHAVTRPAQGPYDRATVLFTAIGSALVRSPDRLAALLAVGAAGTVHAGATATTTAAGEGVRC
jgi:aminoglycoside phosphotransferase (APT) family kinase protein